LHGYDERLARVAMNLNLTLENENKEDHKRHGRPTSKIYKQRESPGEEQKELPKIAVSARNSLPNVPVGMGGTKYKSKNSKLHSKVSSRISHRDKSTNTQMQCRLI